MPKRRNSRGFPVDAGLYALVESSVLNVLKLSGRTILADATAGIAPFDFAYEDEEGRKIAVEVKTLNQSLDFNRLRGQIEQSIGFAEFCLVTPFEPSAAQLKTFKSFAGPKGVNLRWETLEQFSLRLGYPHAKSLSTLGGLVALRTEAMIAEYKRSITKAAGVARQKRHSDDADSPWEYIGLRRQFSEETLKELFAAKGGVSGTTFHVGSRFGRGIVIITDIMNFSKLVEKAPQERLNIAMSKFYLESRKMVWRHGGMLDKFIGDATLAVFNYPKESSASFVNAVRFACGQIQIARQILDELCSSMDAKIDTGLRCGVALGDLWPLNIGDQHIELTLVGDPINLAARLEKQAPVNGVLLSNYFKSELANANADFEKSLNLAPKILEAAQVKGSDDRIQVAELSPTTAQRIATAAVE